jgi:hypothetical protein
MPMEAILRGSTEKENIGDRLMSSVAGRFLQEVGFERTYRLSHWSRRYRSLPEPHKIEGIFDLGAVYYCDSFRKPVGERIRRSIRFNRAFPRATNVYLPCSWGPYRGKDHTLVKRLTRDAIVFARDRISLDYLNEALGSERARFCPDLAFLCGPEDPRAGADLLRQLGVSGGEPLLGLIPNARCAEEGVTPLRDTAVYRGHLEYVVRWAGQNGFRVIGISHMVDTDRDRLLLEGLGIPIARSDSPPTTRSVIANLSVAVCSRYHGLVNCLVHGVPPVSLGWQHKYRGLMDHFDLLDFDQPIAGDRAELGARLESLTASRERTAERIRGRLEASRSEIRSRMGWLSGQFGGPPTVLEGSIRIDEAGIETLRLPRASRIARLRLRVKRLAGH